MALYEQSWTDVYPVESPLTEEYDTDWWPDEWAEDPYDDVRVVDPLRQVQRRMMLILVIVAAFVGISASVILPTILRGRPEAETAAAPQGAGETAVGAVPAASQSQGEGISPIFSPEVQHWEDQIIAWAAQHNVDPNMVATIMQIESCGDPQAVSHAGAQGLFQVMPFHFGAGEDTLDPDTNAYRGLNYFVERLQQTGGDVGRAFAGYNGGHVAAASSYDSWANETQRYYVWSTGIYEDASAGLTESPTLQQWFSAGGTSLCRQARQRLGLN